MEHTNKILVVDDEELVRDALEMVLLRSGFEVKSAYSAIKGLEICQENQFDVILTDIVMPEMDGVAFIKELRNRNIKTPIITITGGARVGQKNMSSQAKEAGACQTLRKPVNKKQILDAIDKALELSL